MSLRPSFIPYGDGAMLVRFQTDGYSRQVVDSVHTLRRQLLRFDIWEELVPGYDSLLLVYNPMRMNSDTALDHVEAALENPPEALDEAGRIVEIPVCYGGEYGPDMGNIMASSGLSESDIIECHASQDYLVCMMGFIPGFSFLSEAPKVLHHARHDTPRLSVPAGSVGIAGWQTGIYGLESPGGWQIIGRTPLTLFDKNREEPFLLNAGDQVKFIPINADAFHA